MIRRQLLSQDGALQFLDNGFPTDWPAPPSLLHGRRVRPPQSRFQRPWLGVRRPLRSRPYLL